jgi:uncharacterized membrane protein YiaA
MIFNLRPQSFYGVYLYSYFAAYCAVVFVLGKEGFAATPFIRLSYVAVTSILFLLLIASKRLSKTRLSNDFDLLAKIMVLFGVVWFVIGVHNANFYLASDFVYYFFILCSFYFFSLYGLYLKDKAHLFISGLDTVFIVISLLLIVSQIFFSTQPYFLYLPISVYLVTTLFIYKRGEKKFLKTVLVLTLLVGVTDLNRAFYLQFIVLVVFATLALRGSNKLINLGVKFLFIFTILIVLFDSFGNFIEGTQLHRRIVETSNIFQFGISEEVSIPMLQRMYEKQVIMDMFYDKPLMLLTGYGFGAYFDMKDSLDIWLIESQLFGAEQVHNVHFLHMALLFRFGIIGFALYSCILIFVIRRLLGLRKNTTIENKDQFFISAFGGLYIISATAFASTASSTFFVDPLIGFSLACVGFYHNIRHQSKW